MWWSFLLWIGKKLHVHRFSYYTIDSSKNGFYRSKRYRVCRCGITQREVACKWAKADSKELKKLLKDMAEKEAEFKVWMEELSNRNRFR
jgi:chromosome condensin MukBEF complex kleisin-like MukF subunit